MSELADKNVVIRGAGGGGKKGGGRSADDTLRSFAHVRAVDAISEGEIEGLVDGANSILINKTPLPNIKEASWQYRAGLPDDAPMVGVDTTEAFNSVGAEVSKELGPVVRTITDQKLDAVKLIMQLNVLYKIDKKGALKTTDSGWIIEMRSGGGEYQTLIDYTLKGEKTMSPTQFEHILPLAGSGPWDIRVSAKYGKREKQEQNITWAGYSEITGGRFTHPHTAMVGLALSSEHVGTSMPERLYHIKGRKILVPTNYDPITREYTGVWDGTFKRVWSNNPAWIFYDMVENNVFGIGDNVPLSAVSKWRLYSIAQYCDQLVPSGYTDDQGQMTYEPRFTFNGVITDKKEAFDALRSMTTVWRGMGFYALDQFFVTADMAQDPAHIYGPGNVVDGRFEYTTSSIKARHSVVMVRYNDPDNLFEPAIEPYVDNELVKKFGWREKTVELTGCASRSLAHRYAKWIVETEKSETETVSFTVGLDSIHALPGEVISINDPRRAQVRMSGRLVGIDQAAGTLTLDQPVNEAITSTITVHLQRNDGQIETITGEIIGDRTVIHATDLTNVNWAYLQPNAFYALSSGLVAPRQYRIVTIDEDANNKFKITGLQYDATKFARIENGISFDPIPTKLDTSKLEAPADLIIGSTTYVEGGQIRNDIEVAWTPSPSGYVVKYNVFVDTPSEKNKLVGSTSRNSLTYSTYEAGDHTFRVTAEGVTGSTSATIEQSVLVAGIASIDVGTVANFVNAATLDGGANVPFDGRDIALSWRNMMKVSSDTTVEEVDSDNALYAYTALEFYVDDVKVRTQRVKGNHFIYTYAMNKDDCLAAGFASANRAVRIEAYIVDNEGRISANSTLSVLNAAPQAIAPVVKIHENRMDVSWAAPNEDDIKGYLVWVMPSSDPVAGVPPTADVQGNSFSMNGTGHTDYWISVAAYDAFGKDLLTYATPVKCTTLYNGAELDAVITDAIDAAKADSANALTTARQIQNSVAQDTQAAIDAANSAKTAAETARDQAAAANTAAQSALTGANTAKTDAETASAQAATALTDAQAARDNAQTYQNAAQAAQSASESARDDAQTAATTAGNSATAAAGSASNASTSETNAGNSATAAQASAVAASSSADDASSAATAASSSASSAATSATNAGNSASAAQTAKTAAETAKSGAVSAQNAAVTAKNDAQSAASTATTQAGIATTAATDAGNSATAASNSASSASTSATNASQSASSASTSANTATTKAGQASTSASQAATSATNAAGSATAASSSATTAASASGAAKAVAEKLLPDTFADGKTYWLSGDAATDINSTDQPGAPSVQTVDEGVVLRIQDTSQIVSPKGYISRKEGRTYRFTIRQRLTVAHNTADGLGRTTIGLLLYRADGTRIGGWSQAKLFEDISVNDGWRDLVYETTIPATSNSEAVAYWRPHTQFGMAANSWVSQNGVQELLSFRVEDVTSELSAAGSASAAASSASNAAASETAAGQSASAAQTAKTAAETAKAGADSSKTAAATSATNAASSASSASTSATNAANSATAAGNSATAAQTSASTASTKATEAAQSATSASSSASTATTKAGQASTSASQAATSASDAAGSANSASTSATNAANSATAAGNSASAASTSASTASTKATEASQSASAAAGSATTASTKAGQASTSASQAATSESNAAGSANAAASSATVSADAKERVVSLQGNPYFEFDKEGWKTVNGWSPGAPASGNANGTIVNTGAYANKALQFTNTATLHSGRYIPVDVNRTYRVKIRLRCLSSSPGPATCFCGVATYTASLGLQSENPGSDRYGVLSGATIPNDDVWREYQGDFTGTAATTNSFRPGTAFVTVMALTSYSQNDGRTVEIDYLTFEDVTSEVAAEGSAAAAASSASSAAASETAAGQSASAAQTAKTAAETAKSGADSSKTAAATSATNAASSASQAATSATNAANSATNAGNSATAASNSASTASTKASEASSSATSASTSANTATTKAGEASTSASSAATSASNAAGSANTAATSATVAARMSQGACVIDDPLFNDYATKWANYNTGPTLIANEVYPFGKTLKFVTTTSSLNGSVVAASGWSGAKNADAYVIEVVFTLVSGALGGSGILFDWWNTASGNYRATLKLGDMLREPVALNTVTTAQALVPRGALSGTFLENKVYFMANYSTGLDTRVAKEIHVHAIRIRVATSEEMGLGKVGAAISAAVSTETTARTTAINSLTNTVNTQQSSIGTINATLSQQGTTLATLDGTLSSSYLMRAEAGGATGTVELVASQDMDGGPSSALKIKVDNLDLEGNLNADWITAGKMSTEQLTVDTVLSINAATGALSAGRSSPADSADGITFGRYNGKFGFSAGRTNNDKKQELIITPETGLRFINARHFVTSSIPATFNPVLTSQTVQLPAGTKTITLEILGAGQGGMAGGSREDGYDPALGHADPGGDTIVRLYDNGVDTGIFWTALGGNRTSSFETGNNNGGNGQSSAYGTGGKGGYTTTTYDSENRPTTHYYAGADASGYGAGGGGGYGNRGGAGGLAGELVNIYDFDVSGYANPSLVFELGDGSMGGTAAVSKQAAARKGGKGSNGRAAYMAIAEEDVPADVLPLRPTAAGTFVASASATGPNVFPDLGGGLWILTTGTANVALNLGDIEVNTNGDRVYLNGITHGILLTDKTPDIKTGAGNTRTIYYLFYSMGAWG